MHRFICVAYDPSRPKRVNYFPVRLCEGPKKIESGNSQASAQHFQPSISEFIGPMQSIRGSGKLGFGIRISGPGFQSPAYS